MLLPTLLATPGGANARGLVGYWPLVQDVRDHSGRFGQPDIRGVAFRNGAAWFDGAGSRISIPSAPSLRVGEGSFSISLWVHTDAVLDDVLGDILNKFDPSARTGFNLSIMHYAGVVTTQVNTRNLFFGVDDGSPQGGWTDCGRPGNSIFVMSLCVFNGNLYAGTSETGKGELGHVYRYRGGKRWEDCGSPDNCNAIQSLVVYNGRLYAGSAYHDPHGSLLAESDNKQPGGRVFRYEGGKKWAYCGRLGDGITTVHGLTEFRDNLYAFSWYEKGFFRYDGGATWTRLADPGSRFLSMTPSNGYLYATANRLTPLPPDGKHSEQKIVSPYAMWRFDDRSGRWTGCGLPGETTATQIYSSMIHYGQIHTGSWPNGTVFRFAGGGKWEDCGRVGDEEEVMGLIVYNGKLYAGALPSASVYRYDGDRTWTNTGQLDRTPEVRFRRAFTPVVFQGKLFCGTLPSGHVYSFEAGRAASCDFELKPGWRHVVAVKGRDRLLLYVDGRRVATSSRFPGARYDVSNDRPLEIGFGANDYFHGGLRDLRIFDYALSEADIADLARGRTE